MTQPLQQLTAWLQPAVDIAARPMPDFDAMDDVLVVLKRQAKSRTSNAIPIDQQRAALDRFWDESNTPSFRDIYLLSWGLSLPRHPGGPCLVDDQDRLARLLNEIDAWLEQPRNYRRCYQGLISGYFNYDGLGDTVSNNSRRNWYRLRDYLDQRNDRIIDAKFNSDWVQTAIEHRTLFGADPYSRYIGTLLDGNSHIVDSLCEQLGISKASWFQRELVLAQIRGATIGNDSSFMERLPRLLDLLGKNEILRDRGLVMMLDRYARIDGKPLHPQLRDAAILWWNNPWLPSNATRWGGVTPQAREMVADWLKNEFIETFFTKLAEDGLGDTRRMVFWKRYVKQIDHIEFALGALARNSRDRDFVALRRKMAGVICEFDVAGANNAFIMRMGSLVAVEFSELGNALYGYDAEKALPFDTRQPLQQAVNARNSLKHRPRNALRLLHKDDASGWGLWEQTFEAELRTKFNISPGEYSPAAPKRPSGMSAPPTPPFQARPTPNQPPKPAQSFTRDALRAFAREYKLQIEDKTEVGGNLWIRAGNNNPHVARTLAKWGFRYKEGKGWWMSAKDA